MAAKVFCSVPRVGIHDDAEWLQWMPGERFAVRVSSANTSGRYALLEVEASPGCGTPLHIHHNEDEHLIVLDETVRIVCGQRTLDASAGMTLPVPKGVSHAWANLSDAPIRMLAVFVPGGIEDLFRELVAAGGGSIQAIAATYGCSLVGPGLGG